MSDRLKLSNPKGDAEANKIASALEEAEYKRRYEELKKNIHDLEKIIAEKDKAAWKTSSSKTTNNKLGARKNGKFKAVSTAPSINRTPAGPCMVQVAYPTSADLTNSVSVASTVRFNGNAAYTLNSSQPTCKGDERGTGGGVRSGTVNGEVKPTGASTTVRAQGSRVVRAGDPNTMNNGNNPGVYVTEPPTSGASPKDAVATSNPPVKLQTPQENSAIRRWLDKTVVQMSEALQHPVEGVKGAIKGTINMPAHVLQMLLETSARQRAAELDEAAGIQQIFGNSKVAASLTEVASETRQKGAQVDVPTLPMSNVAQEGGESILDAIQVFAAGTGAVKVAARLAKPGKIKELARELRTAERSAKGANFRRTGGTVGTADGVKVASTSRSIPLREKRLIEPAEANRNFEKPPFAEGAGVIDGALVHDEAFVRLYDGDVSSDLGRWVMPKSEIRGLSPEQIRNKFALPSIPKFIVDVEVPAGTRIRIGEAGRIAEWGGGGGTQIQLMDRIPISAYRNARPYP